MGVAWWSVGMARKEGRFAERYRFFAGFARQGQEGC
jgi:hypothetical protein